MAYHCGYELPLWLPLWLEVNPNIFQKLDDKLKKNCIKHILPKKETKAKIIQKNHCMFNYNWRLFTARND